MKASEPITSMTMRSKEATGGMEGDDRVGGEREDEKGALRCVRYVCTV